MSDNNTTATNGRYSTQREVSPLEITNDDITPDNNNSNNNFNSQTQTQTQTIEEQYNSEREQTKSRHWQQSDYAAGLVEPTWDDEYETQHRHKNCCVSCCCPSPTMGGGMFNEEIDPGCGCIYLSAVCCSKLGAGRVGNMAILKERYVMVEVDDEDEDNNSIKNNEDNNNSNIEEGQEQMDGYVNDNDDLEDGGVSLHQRSNGNNKRLSSSSLKNGKPTNTTKRLVRKREIQYVLGPFWPMLLFITYPLIFGVSALTLYSAIPGKPWYVQLGWSILTLQLIRSLFLTGFRDPGILPRHRDPPAVQENDDSNNTRKRGMGFRWGNEEGGPWRWSDQAQSYRPRNAAYCQDCKVCPKYIARIISRLYIYWFSHHLRFYLLTYNQSHGSFNLPFSGYN